MRFIRPITDRSFVGHYIEMVVAMYAGMFVIGMPLTDLAGLFGADLHHDAPAFMFLDMAVVMTVPMVAWMRFRHQHTWKPCLEMAASMFIPTAVAIALLTLNISDYGTLMTFEHLAMFPAMLIAMLIRPDEYTGHHDHAPAPVAAPATA
jgi:hypothetical protein